MALSIGGVSIPRRWIWSICVVLVFGITTTKRLVATGPVGDLEWILDLAAAVAAAWAIRWGFRRLREKNMIENVPRSPIRSVAMGLAEITGQAVNEGALPAPLSGAMCVYYRYLVEEERRSGRSRSRWVTIDQGESSAPFRVEDPTGRILINPPGGEMMLGRDYRDISRDGGWLSRRTRRSEWRIHPGDFVYVIGSVAKLHNLVADERLDLQFHLQQIKKDPAALKRFDLDGDGTINTQEWAGAVAVTKDEVFRDRVSRPAEPQENLCIGKGDAEDTFLISDRDERSLILSLGWRAFGSIAAGGAGFVVMASSILGRFGILPVRWTFPWESLLR